MSKEKIITELKEIVQDYVELDNEFSEEMSLQGDIGLDSFGLISMVCQIEKHFNVRIPDHELPNFLKLTDLVVYLQENALAV